ncbi:MAG: twin-arginine translocase TatA/TatE family subunit [Coriobacteriaceae bacterium]|nr:twin-arginine translocase TatA/TatE family subunit [Coriobacteriaceae bacterium]
MLPKGFEWVIILIVALLIFGPKNLPKLGKSLGSTVKNLREGMANDDKQDAQDVEAETVIEDSDDAEIRELEAKLAAAKAKKEEADGPISSN